MGKLGTSRAAVAAAVGALGLAASLTGAQAAGAAPRSVGAVTTSSTAKLASRALPATYVSALERLINGYRGRYGQAALRVDKRLQAPAQSYAQTLATAHVLQHGDFPAVGVAQSIAAATARTPTGFAPQQMLALLVSDELHRNVLLTRRERGWTGALGVGGYWTAAGAGQPAAVTVVLNIGH